MSRGMETIEVIDTWLYTTLAGDQQLLDMLGDGDNSIISTLAIAGVKAPYVAFFMSSARDIMAVGMIRVQVDALYTVKTVGEGASWEVVRPIAARVDELLHEKNVTTGSGSLACHRESVIQFAEIDQATQFRHLGGLFRVRANTL